MARGIDPDTLYIVRQGAYDEAPPNYGITPDGVGMYWYDTREEAEADLPEVYRTVRLTDDELEERRYGA